MLTFGERSGYEAYFRTASAPKTFRWYRAGHSLNPRARADRDAWLRARLGF
jgi:predicted esterase